MGPQARRSSSADWRLGAAIGLVFLIFYAGFTHGRFKGTDEVGLFQATESLYEHGTLAVPVHRHAHLGVDNRLYPPFAIGQSVLALPLYAVAQAARAVLPTSWALALAGERQETIIDLGAKVRQRMGPALDNDARAIERARYRGSLEIFFVGLYAPIVSALLTMSLFLLLRQLDVSPASSLVATLLIGACSYPAMMSTYFLRHTTETLTVVCAFALFRGYRDTGRISLLALGSCFASLTFLVRFPGVLAGPPLALYVLHCLWERCRSRELRGWLPDLTALALPLAACVAIHMGINYQKWGSPLGSPMVTAGLETSTSFGTSLGAFLLSPGIGVFAYSPLLLLLPWTARVAVRRWPWECAAFALYALMQLLFFANYRYWTGLFSAPGPRYLFPAGVLLLLPLGAWLDSQRSRIGRAALLVLAAAGGLVQFALLTANWAAVMGREGYTSYKPQFGFLFSASASPIPASLRAVADGAIDSWLWRLGAGWPNQEAAPDVALALFAVWAVACGLGVRWLWRLAASQQTSA